MSSAWDRLRSSRHSKSPPPCLRWALTALQLCQRATSAWCCAGEDELLGSGELWCLTDDRCMRSIQCPAVLCFCLCVGLSCLGEAQCVFCLDPDLLAALGRCRWAVITPKSSWKSNCEFLRVYLGHICDIPTGNWFSFWCVFINFPKKKKRSVLAKL